MKVIFFLILAALVTASPAYAQPPAPKPTALDMLANNIAALVKQNATLAEQNETLNDQMLVLRAQLQACQKRDESEKKEDKEGKDSGHARP